MGGAPLRAGSMVKSDNSGRTFAERKATMFLRAKSGAHLLNGLIQIGGDDDAGD
jgi:hypothetical protein